MKTSPCRSCKNDKDCVKNCDIAGKRYTGCRKFQEWFRSGWRELRKAAGKHDD